MIFTSDPKNRYALWLKLESVQKYLYTNNLLAEAEIFESNVWNLEEVKVTLAKSSSKVQIGHFIPKES